MAGLSSRGVNRWTKPAPAKTAQEGFVEGLNKGKEDYDVNGLLDPVEKDQFL